MDRASYDRWWGLLLLFTCVLTPQAGGETGWLYDLVAAERSGVAILWLLLGSLGGAVAFVFGLSRWASRWRHFVNLSLGVVTSAIPLFFPIIWKRYPYADPGRLPLSDVQTIGWVMVVGLGALYAGSGVRIVRPSQPLGQVMAGMGGFLLFVFAFLPAENAPHSYGMQRLLLFADPKANWREIAAFLLFGLAVAGGVINLLRSRFEVVLAKITRICLVTGLMLWIALPFLGRGSELVQHLPVAWGTLRLLGPLFLAIDGSVAFIAISVTRDAT